MKKILLTMLILIVTISLFSSVAIVNADVDNTPAIKVGDLLQIHDRITFKSVNSNSVDDIILPSTYWVKVTDITSDPIYYSVEYNGVSLKVNGALADSMTRYTSSKVNVTYYAPTGELKAVAGRGYTDIPMFSSIDCSNKLADIKDSTTFTFLNAFGSGDSKVYLVAVNDNIASNNNLVGYVRAFQTNNAEIDSNIPSWVKPVEPVTPNPEPEVDNPSDKPSVKPDANKDTNLKPDTQDKPKTSSNDVVKIVLIVCICILAAVLVFLIFKPTRKKNGRYTVDDDDDYDRDDSYNDNY